jgi:signal transduction histidine kinase
MGSGPPGILSITLDISERKHAEAELRATAAELTQRSAALSAAHDRAERARREAEAAARAKGRFLAMMSHELRTPMTGLLGVLDMIEASPSPADPRLRDVRASAETLMRVLDDILDYSRI